jgi:hypothetical protein
VRLHGLNIGDNAMADVPSQVTIRKNLCWLKDNNDD